jgi:uracil-DNA glycosylase
VEISLLPAGAVIFALGGIAHGAVLRAYDLTLSSYSFAHGQVHNLPDSKKMVDSYHCSRYNTNTGRLTSDMFKDVLTLARDLSPNE